MFTKPQFTAALFLLLCSFGCSKNYDTPYNLDAARPLEYGGTLLDTSGAPLNVQAEATALQNNDYFLLGETHTSMTDHLSQAEIIKKICTATLSDNQQKRLPAIGMEFVNVEQQSVLDKFNAGDLGVDDMQLALNWDKSVGYPFYMYRPIFEVAAQYKLPIYALNVPRAVVREARLKGLEGLSTEQKKYLPQQLILSPEAQHKKLWGIFSSHAMTGKSMSGATMPGAAQQSNATGSNKSVGKPKAANKTSAKSSTAQAKQEQEAAEKLKKSFDGFILAQSIWDSVMAENAKKAVISSGRPMVVIVGSGHVEFGWGIARRLQHIHPGSKVLKVMPWRELILNSVEPKQTDNTAEQKLPQRDPRLPGGGMMPIALIPYPAEEPQAGDVYYYSPFSALTKVWPGLLLTPNAAPAPMSMAMPAKSSIPNNTGVKSAATKPVVKATANAGDADKSTGQVAGQATEQPTAGATGATTGRNIGGLKIIAVENGSIAAQSGLQPDDIIIEAAKRPLQNIEEFNELATQAYLYSAPLPLKLLRADKEIELSIK